MDDRHRLMAEVEAAQTALARLLLTDQLLPVLNSPLTMQQLRFMALLYRDGPTPGHRLAAQLNVSMPTVSGTVDRLVEHGMIARRVDDRDRRVRLVELTPAGEQMLTSFQEAGWRMGREVMAEMDGAGLRALAAGMAEVVEVARRRHERAGGASRGAAGA